MRKLSLILLASFLLSIFIVTPIVNAQPVRVWTDRSVYGVGDPVRVTFEVSTGVPGPGRATVIIRGPAGTYSYGPINVVPGGRYRVTLTGVTVAPGTYTVRVGVLVIDVLYQGSTSFSVSGAPGGGGFDFTIALSPSAQTVEQGGTATFRILLTYSSPAFAGTRITIQITGLGPGMTWRLVGNSIQILTSSTTPTGTYTVVLIGSARGVTHQASALLVVVPRGATPTPGFDFSVSISPSTQTVRIGDKASYSVTVSLVSGSAQSVSLTLSGLPSDLTYSFSPQSGTPTFSSTLTVDASAASSTGSYTLTVTASGGGASKTATATLVVKEAADFAISVSPSSASAKQGEKTSFNVAVNPVGGFDKPVALAVSGLPVGASPTFTVPSGKPPFTSTLMIDVSPTAPEGTYSLTIDASSEGKTRSATVTLIVKPKSGLTISASSQGGKVTVTGSLAPPVEGAEVTLTYHGPNGETVTRKAIVGFDGTFRDVYSPEAPGEWSVTASWPGNDEYLAAASQGESFVIRKGLDVSSFLSNPTNLLLVVVALVAVVAIALAARRRGGAPAPQPRPAASCPNCGTPVKPGDAFCPNCGKALK